MRVSFWISLEGAKSASSELDHPPKNWLLKMKKGC